MANLKGQVEIKDLSKVAEEGVKPHPKNGFRKYGILFPPESVSRAKGVTLLQVYEMSSGKDTETFAIFLFEDGRAGLYAFYNWNFSDYGSVVGRDINHLCQIMEQTKPLKRYAAEFKSWLQNIQGVRIID